MDKSALPLESREYQTRIETKTRDALLVQSLNSVLIESPTGSGKTVMGLRICKLIQDVFPKTTVGWSAMRRKILDQAAEENQRIKVQNIEYVSMFDKTPPKVDLLVVDEAQHDAASSNQDLINASKMKWRLGLTATPFRTDHVKLSFDKVISDCGIRFLVEQGYLSKFDQYYIPVWTPECVTSTYLREPDHWAKSVMFFHTELQCVEALDRLKAGGIKAEYICGKMSYAERDAIMDAFDKGEIRVLINMYLLTEGFDATDLTTVFVRDNSKLPTMQMCGRGMRLYPTGHPLRGTPKNIVQSEKTHFPFSRVVKPVHEFVWNSDTNSWFSMTGSKQIDGVLMLVQEKVMKRNVVLPDYIRNGGMGSISLTKKGNISHKAKKKKKSLGLTALFGGNDDEGDDE